MVLSTTAVTSATAGWLKYLKRTCCKIAFHDVDTHAQPLVNSPLCSLKVGEGDKGALKKTKKKQVGFLSRLADMVRGQLNKVERKRVVALITMEIHNRDVMQKVAPSLSLSPLLSAYS